MSLTTFRRSGEGVPTPVWCAPDGDGLVVTTMAGTGKVKRVRRTPRVTLRPCTRSGQVAPDAPEVEEPGEVRRLSRLLTRKYGLLARLFFATDRLPFRRPKQRVILRLRPAAPTGADPAA